MSLPTTPIFVLTDGCARGFERLEQKLGYPTIVNVTNPDKIVRFKTLTSRFTRWSRNARTHSLDQELQDNNRIKLQIIRLLSHIQRLLRDAHAITVGKMIPWDQIEDKEDSQSEDDAETLNEFTTAEIGQILAHIDDAISNLSYLNPALRGSLADARTTDEPSPFEPFDIQHVRSMYPEIDSAIAERLGKAISARRQLFKHKQDQQSLSFYGGTLFIPEMEPLAEQIALEDLTHRNNEANEIGPELSSVTSCSAVDDARASRVPVFPQEATQGNLFRCVYCQGMVKVHSEAAWKKHVYQDLQPYVCLEEDCLTPRYREHLRQTHGDHVSAAEDEDLVQLGTFNETGFPKGSCCPFCKLELQDIKTYQSHVGEHQRRLALFALPLTSESFETGTDEAGPSSVQEKKPLGQDDESSRSKDAPDRRRSIGIGSHSGKNGYSNHPGGQERKRRRVQWQWACCVCGDGQITIQK
ncbi:uncharacterized protein FSUBG_5698 [Fusarium subglutinans]|uniref:Oxidoreductase acuF-like C2H2 type zinc-finger domain-containing protein n=1 Tax=Gibberella subglutinans TaxID=42677 RepID=A0A8H5Q2J5_GIBSU|nr:uncharacterized protein FSUBG_5698 [Fusarium subglutinans]KAF5606862.1 hypothetical protein FSUBG_5698 [Fusarium subglutinans]